MLHLNMWAEMVLSYITVPLGNTTLPRYTIFNNHFKSVHTVHTSHQHLFEEVEHFIISKIMQHGALCTDLIAGSWRVSVTWHLTWLLLVLFRPHAGETLQLDKHKIQVKGKRSDRKNVRIPVGGHRMRQKSLINSQFEDGFTPSIPFINN